MGYILTWTLWVMVRWETQRLQVVVGVYHGNQLGTGREGTGEGTGEGS